jgi:hypothetical protein
MGKDRNNMAGKEIKKCKCGSTDLEHVKPFYYIKKCKKCGEVFSSVKH